jgi:hypothetical protein
MPGEDNMTIISTSSKSENDNQSKLHVYIHTYIHTKREQTDKTRRASIVTYDNEKFLRLIEIAKRNKTSASAIISNFIDCFVEYFDEKPATLDQFLDPDFVQTPKVTDLAEEVILSYLKKQDTQTLQHLDSNLYRAHVFARVLAQMKPDQRRTLTSDYPYVWRTFYK